MLRVLLLLLVSVGVTINAAEQTRGWEPVSAGVILIRNVKMPQSPELDGYRLLGPQYRLGTAYAKAPPPWWLKMVDDAKIGDKWHPKDFPLAYAGEFTGKDGKGVLLVVQVSHAFTGDGYWSPGPVIYLVARVLARGENPPKLLTEQARAIGDSDGAFQNKRLYAGEANGRQIVFRTDGSGGLHSAEIAPGYSWSLTLGDDNALRFQKEETTSNSVASATTNRTQSIRAETNGAASTTGGRR